jgi:hypothetical protein
MPLRKGLGRNTAQREQKRAAPTAFAAPIQISFKLKAKKSTSFFQQSPQCSRLLREKRS